MDDSSCVINVVDRIALDAIINLRHTFRFRILEEDTVGFYYIFNFQLNFFKRPKFLEQLSRDDFIYTSNL